MLTREQIQRLASRNRVPAHTEERDYIQSLLLYLIYPTENLVFKGGTALRIVWKSNRRSEDLDFNGYGDQEEILKKAVDDLELYGIEAGIRGENLSDVSYSFRLTYKGPLYLEESPSMGGTGIHVSLRGEEIEAERRLVTTQYDDVGSFPLKTLTLDHIFAEKVRALMIRKKPRHLYDLWFLLEKGVTPKVDLMDKKLSIYDERFDKDGLIEAIEVVKNRWNQDFAALLPTIPNFEELSDHVKSRLLGSF